MINGASGKQVLRQRLHPPQAQQAGAQAAPSSDLAPAGSCSGQLFVSCRTAPREHPHSRRQSARSASASCRCPAWRWSHARRLRTLPLAAARTGKQVPRLRTGPAHVNLSVAEEKPLQLLPLFDSSQSIRYFRQISCPVFNAPAEGTASHFQRLCPRAGQR